MTPRSSVVVPVHNRAGLTRRCLDALLSEPPAVETELIVVDDASTDTTADVLAAYGESIRTVTRSTNGGFAAACNDGAASTLAPYVVFLNNDTVPSRGWLDALVAYADRHPRAGVVGSKLLFPNETVQHAGVVICQDGRPRHLYAGFPADHAAVSRARRFQAVTFACALVRKDAFEEVGGLDVGFRNCLEDADFCLRAGEHGWEVHYCPDSVVHHLESVSRGRRSKEFQQSERLFRDRWEDRARRDDFDYYLEDRLLRVRYRDRYPMPMEISPQLGLTSEDKRLSAVEDLLNAATREAIDLLRENARLTTHIAESALAAPPGDRPREEPPVRNGSRSRGAADAGDLLRRLREVEQQIYELQAELAARIDEGTAKADQPDPTGERFTPSEHLGYRKLVGEVRESVLAALPSEATVLIVSRGDDDLLALDNRLRALHFPQDAEGLYAGAYPKDSETAIAELEQLRARGAEYIVFPSTSFWWLDHYVELNRHLEGSYELVTRDSACIIFALRSKRADRAAEKSAARGS